MIKKKWDPKKGKHIWGYDITLRDPVTGKKTRRLRHYECETQDEAREIVSALVLADREAKYGLRPMDLGPMLAELIEKRLNRTMKRNQRVMEKRALGIWQEILPKEIRVRDIKAIHIRSFIEKQEERGLAPNTINRQVTVIAAALHQAGELFEVLEQWKPPKIPRPKISRRRRNKIITDQEYSALITQLMRPQVPGERTRRWEDRILVAQIVQWAMNTAMRHGEISGLKWSNIDWDSNPPKAVVHQTKTDSDKHIPLTKLLVDILHDRKKKQGASEYIFSTSGVIQIHHYKILREACEAAGVPYGRDREDGLVLHSARHTVTTRLADSGLNLDTIGLITGHAAKTLIADYTHFTPESVKLATKVLEAVGGGAKPEKENS